MIKDVNGWFDDCSIHRIQKHLKYAVVCILREQAKK